MSKGTIVAISGSVWRVSGGLQIARALPGLEVMCFGVAVRTRFVAAKSQLPGMGAP